MHQLHAARPLCRMKNKRWGRAAGRAGVGRVFEIQEYSGPTFACAAVMAAGGSQFNEVLRCLVETRPFASLVRLAERPALGDGRFGRVFQAVWLPTGELVAVKVPLSADFKSIGEKQSVFGVC